MPRGVPRPGALPLYIRANTNRAVYDYWGANPCYRANGRMYPDERSCHKPCRPEFTERKREAGINSPWNKALKEFNKWKYDKNGKRIERNAEYVVPMKGTDNYKKVLRLMKKYVKKSEESEEDEPVREVYTDAFPKTRSQTAARAPAPPKAPPKTPPKKTTATKKPIPKKVKYDKRIWKEPPSARNPNGVMW